MKTLLMVILIFVTSFPFCSACKNECKNETIRRYYYRREDLNRIVHCTIICSNVYSIKDIFYQYQHNNYDQFLKIADSNITTLHPNQFSKFPTIVKLYLSGIHLKEILPDAFSGLTDLKELYLDRNELTEVPEDIFTALEQLTVLDLSYNRIDHIEGSMNNTSLEELRLQGNNLSEIGDDTFNNWKLLRVLDLSGNPLKRFMLPNESYELHLLLLNNTLVKELSDSADIRLSRWAILNMTSNQITSVNFSMFPKVLTLDLSNNSITVIESCQNITAERFYAQNNKIRFIKCGFNRVYHLSLSHNELESINQTLLENSRSILSVDLSYNRISVIESNAFENLTSLEELYLGNNNVSNLELGLFHDLKHLRLLSLRCNNIKKLKYGIFDNLVSLRTLDISHNNILHFDIHMFYTLSQLHHLNLAYINISWFDVKDVKPHFRRLESISLDGNSWKCQQLAQIDQVLKNMSVILLEGDSYDVENYKGIVCQNNNSSLWSPYEIFAKYVNESIKNSKFQRLLNEEFKSSNFFKFFEKLDRRGFSIKSQNFKGTIDGSVELKDSSVKTESGKSGVLVSSLVLQVVMCFLLIFIALIVLRFLKKQNQENHNLSSSQVELHSNET